MLVFGLIILSVVACGEEEFNSVDASVVAQGNFYGGMQESIFKSCAKITGNSDWQELRKKMCSLKDVSPDFLETNIDFSRYDIIAVFDRIRIGEYYVVTLDLVEGRNMLFVKVGHEKIINQQIINNRIQSYLIVKMPKSNKSIQVNDIPLDK